MAELMTDAMASQYEMAKQSSFGANAQFLPYTLWDTQDFIATAGTMDFFSVPQGVGKSSVKTNLKQPSQLPVNQNFRFFEIQARVINKGANAAALDANANAAIFALQNSSFTFIIDGREFDTQFTGGEMFPAIAHMGAATSGIGRLTAKGSRRLGREIQLSKLAPFTLKVQFDAAANAALATLNGATGAQLQVGLVGRLLRRQA